MKRVNFGLFLTTLVFVGLVFASPDSVSAHDSGGIEEEPYGGLRATSIENNSLAGIEIHYESDVPGSFKGHLHKIRDENNPSREEINYDNGNCQPKNFLFHYRYVGNNKWNWAATKTVSLEVLPNNCLEDKFDPNCINEADGNKLFILVAQKEDLSVDAGYKYGSYQPRADHNSYKDLFSPDCEKENSNNNNTNQGHDDSGRVYATELAGVTIRWRDPLPSGYSRHLHHIGQDPAVFIVGSCDEYRLKLHYSVGNSWVPEEYDLTVKKPTKPGCFTAAEYDQSLDLNCYPMVPTIIKGGTLNNPEWMVSYNQSAISICSSGINSGLGNTGNTGIVQPRTPAVTIECNIEDLSRAAFCPIPDAPGDGVSISDLIQKVVRFLSYIVGISAVVMLMLQGLRMIFSGGDSNTIGEARNGIIYAVIGLVVAIFAPSIIEYALKLFGA